MALSNNAQILNVVADQLVRKALEEKPENPVGVLLLALLKARRLAGVADAELVTRLSELQRRNPRPN